MNSLSKPTQDLGPTARSILTLLRQADLSGTELAGALQVSAQTASVLTRDLEAAGFILKGPPKRGKVGKPQTPWALNPDGAFGIGLRIGRRSADFVLMDLVGAVRYQQRLRYAVPTPQETQDFLRRNFEAAQSSLGPEAHRLAGFGIAAPSKLWSWIEGFEPAPDALEAWSDFSFTDAIAPLSDLPVVVANDATMACQGEFLFGAGRGLGDFAYFYIGALLGGGVVLNGRIYEGAHGNAGDFAAIPIGDVRLSALGSLAQLENALARKIGSPVSLGSQPELWQTHPREVSDWLTQSSDAIAQATLALRAVLDVPTIILDGGMPAEVKSQLVRKVATNVEGLDQRGLHPTDIFAGQLGDSAGAFGAANIPLLNAYFLEGAKVV